MTTVRTRTLSLALGDSVNTGLTALLAVVLTRLLTKDDYGTYRQLLLVYTLLTATFGSHLAESLLYFVPRSDAADRSRWLGQTAWLSIGIGLLVTACILLSAELWGRWTGNPRLAPLLRVFAAFPVADRVVRMISPALLSQDRPRTAAVFTITAGMVRVVTTVLPCVLGASLVVILASLSVAWFGVATLGLLALAASTRIDPALPKSEGVRAQFRYVAPLVAAWILATLHEQLGQLVAASVLTTADFAEFAVGAVPIPLVGIWTASIASAMLPDLVRLSLSGAKGAMLPLWRRGIRKGALVVFPVAAIALVVPDHLIHALYGRAYLRATIPFVIFALALPARVTNYGVLFRAVGRTRAAVVWSAAGLVVNIAVTLAAVGLGRDRDLLFVAPALGYLVGTYAAVAAVLFLLRRSLAVTIRDLLPLRDLGSIGGLTLVAAAVAASSRFVPVSTLFPSIHPSFSAGLQCLLAVAGFGATFLSVGLATSALDTSERAALRSALQRLPVRAARP